MARTALTLAAVAILCFAGPQAGGAGPSGPAPAPPGAPPEPAPTAKTGEGAGTKTEADDKPKPAETPPSPGSQSPAPPSDGQSTLAALMREGFEVRTTAFVPAEAVTRQSGKVSSDAIVVTLQKEAASAVCFYTLKAYVSRKLSTIPACIVHR
jgi:hypothetical protein